MNENNKLKSKELIIELLALVDADKHPQLELLQERVSPVYASCLRDNIKAKKLTKLTAFAEKCNQLGGAQ